MEIALAGDHSTIGMKDAIKKYLEKNNIKFKDFGTMTDKSVDYPDIISKAAAAVSCGKLKRGIVICGTGIGASIVANKYPGIRAALVLNEDMAELSKQHNNANILVLGARLLKINKAIKLVKIWLNTPFSNAERHSKRINKIRKIEKKLNII